MNPQLWPSQSLEWFGQVKTLKPWSVTFMENLVAEEI